MTAPEDLTIEQLETLLIERRAEERRANDTPKPLDEIDTERMINAAKKHIAFCASSEYHSDNDETTWIYEDIIEAVYGPTIWDWINGREE